MHVLSCFVQLESVLFNLLCVWGVLYMYLRAVQQGHIVKSRRRERQRQGQVVSGYVRHRGKAEPLSGQGQDSLSF